MTDRRTFLKGLAGTSLGMLLAGQIIPDAVMVESYKDITLVVPSKNLQLVEPKPELIVAKMISPPLQVSEYSDHVVMQMPTAVAIVPEGSSVWVRLHRMGGLMQFEIVLARDDDTVQLRVRQQVEPSSPHWLDGAIVYS